MSKHTENALPNGFELENYRIEATIGGGGFSIVYRAIDVNTNERVVIKEYLPNTQATRMADATVSVISEDTTQSFNFGIKRFFAEAAILARINHPNIVKVMNFFRGNNTCYLVMRYEQGKDLKHHIKRYKGKLSERFMRTVFPELLNGLGMLHRHKMLHLDIKPANILLRPGGHPLLLDFGAALTSTVGTKTAVGPHTMTLGFAPIEQHNKGYLGPWTDIYAIGATMWSCIRGKAPPSALERAKKDTMKPAVKQFGKLYSKELLEAIDWCLHLDQTQRPQNTQEVIDLINSAAPLPEALADEDITTEQSVLDKLSAKLPWGKKQA